MKSICWPVAFISPDLELKLGATLVMDFSGFCLSLGESFVKGVDCLVKIKGILLKVYIA